MMKVRVCWRAYWLRRCGFFGSHWAF